MKFKITTLKQNGESQSRIVTTSWIENEIVALILDCVENETYARNTTITIKPIYYEKL